MAFAVGVLALRMEFFKSVFLRSVWILRTVDLAQEHGERARIDAVCPVERLIDDELIAGFGVFSDGLDAVRRPLCAQHIH